MSSFENVFLAIVNFAIYFFLGAIIVLTCLYCYLMSSKKKKKYKRNDFTNNEEFETSFEGDNEDPIRRL